MREYRSGDGRFISVDPLWEISPGSSPYIYSDNNPLNSLDPSGLDGESALDRPNPLDPVRRRVSQPAGDDGYDEVITALNFGSGGQAYQGKHGPRGGGGRPSGRGGRSTPVTSKDFEGVTSSTGGSLGTVAPPKKDCGCGSGSAPDTGPDLVGIFNRGVGDRTNQYFSFSLRSQPGHELFEREVWDRVSKSGLPWKQYGYEVVYALGGTVADIGAVIMVAGTLFGGVPNGGGGNSNISKVNDGIESIKAGRYTTTKTVTSGIATRPYINSPSTIINIMRTGNGTVDAFFPGGLNYVVSGFFNGSAGIFELGINPETCKIYHFLFKSNK